MKIPYEGAESDLNCLVILPKVDPLQVISQLHSMGWKDYKIEAATGLTSGYIAQLRCGNIKKPGYEYVRLIVNLYVEQRQTFHVKTCAQEVTATQV